MNTTRSNPPLLDSAVSSTSVAPECSLTTQVTRRLKQSYAHLVPPALLRRAIRDAEELALGTGFPSLFFPALAEEKVRGVSRFSEIGDALARPLA